MASPGQDPPADALPRVAARPRRLRVCHIMSADLWAGAEVQVATVASYLVGRPEIELTAVLLNEGPLAGELRRLGVPVTVLDEQRHNALAILLSLTRLLRDHPVDVVHTHRYKDTVLGAIAAKLGGVPCLVRTIHGQSEPMRGWDRAKFRIYEGLDRLALRCFADRIIAVSRRMGGSLECGYKPGTVVTIHNGVDLRRIRPTRPPDHVRQELGIDPAALLIGTVGRLSPVKGHAHFLRAARLILERQPGARFLIVGDGPLRPQLESSARQLGIDRACVFSGSRTDIYDLMAAMDVFVLPSLDEGIPMALLEAMAVGVPVVATAVGGVPEVVAHRATGLLVRSGDERALAEACLELARDVEWARTLGDRARRRVEEAFSHEQGGQMLVEAYRDISMSRTADTGTPAARPPRPLLHVVPRVDDRGHDSGPRPSGAHPPPGERVPGSIARGARKLRDAALSLPERLRVHRIRREPRVLVAALRSARNILIVCHGNIIRSPFAARLVAQALGDDRRVRISSAGLAATPGTPPPPMACAMATRLGVDLANHVSSTVTVEAVAESDVIFVMDIPQLRQVRGRFRDARAKAFLLTSLAPESGLEVRDPVDGDESVFQVCYEHISESVRPIVGLLAGRAGRP